MGIGLLANLNVAAHLHSGKLVPVLCQNISDIYGAYLYYAVGIKLPNRASRLIVMRKTNYWVVLSFNLLWNSCSDFRMISH